MSNPGEAATQTTPATTESFEQTVNGVVKQMTKDESGAWQLPEGVEDEQVMYAANAERRRRDTESALSVTKTKLQVAETVNASLKKQVVSDVPLNLTTDQRAELDELKHNDPDAWRKQLNTYEQTAQATRQTGIESAEAEAKQNIEVERRGSVLRRFNEEHPDAQLNDTVLTSEVPPRISNRLKDGKVTFEEFLAEAHTYLTAGKTIAKTAIEAEPNLGTAGGSAKPAASAVEGGSNVSYNDEIF